MSGVRTSPTFSKWRLVPQSGELLHLDMLRFIAATAVVVNHAPDAVGFTFQAGLFVDLFFLISGYVIAHVYSGRIEGWRDYRVFLLRRIARLAPLHWATLALLVSLGVAALGAGLPVNRPETFDVRCLPANAAMVHALGFCPQPTFNGPSWSIGAEMVMYLCAPAIFATARRPAVGITALLALWAALTATTGDQWLGWTATGGAVRALPSFLLGVLLHRCRSSVGVIPCPGVLCSIGLAGLIGGIAFGLSPAWLLILAWLAGIGAIALDLGGQASPMVRRLAPLGQLTYGVYMLCLPVLVVARFLAGLIGLEGAARTAFMASATLSIFPLALVSLVVLEGPARRWLVRGSRGAHYSTSA